MSLLLSILLGLTVTLNGQQYTADGSLTLTPVATPTVTPTPIPVPGLLPVLVPDPQPYTLPAAKRTVQVASQSALDLAIASAMAGDRIVLAAGKYASLNMTYRPGGTASARIVFLGQPGATVDGVKLVSGPSYVTLAGLSIGDRGITCNGVSDIEVAACDVLTTGSACGAYITNTPDGGGRFHFTNSRIRWAGPIVPASYSHGAPMAGIYFEMLRNVGDDLLIEGCLFDGWHDGISLGQMKLAVAAKRAIIRHNWLSRVEDDFAELDGWFETLEFTDNTMGGTEMTALAGISAAPLGPTGPYLIARNSIGGYYKMPLKLNNAIDGALTNGLEFANNICIQPLTDATVGFYLPGPMTGVSNLRIHDNTILSRGALFVTEQAQWMLSGNVIPGMQMDRDRMFSTLERMMYGAPTLFRFLDVSTGRNIYMESLADLQQKFGWEKNGAYAPFTVAPVPIETTPGSGQYFPTAQLCRWKVN